jgi:hypothetical protein
MTSFLNANLPSEDEEDDNYDPTLDPAEGAKKGKAQKGPSRCEKLACGQVLMLVVYFVRRGCRA